MKIDHKKYNVPGILLAVAEQGHQPKIHSAGFGDVKKKQPIDEDGLFRIGYITRMFTACLLMRLVGEGALDLEAPVDTIARLNQQDHGLLNLLVQQYPFLKPVTVWELLTHTSGLPAFNKTLAYNTIFVKNPKKKWQVENYLDAISGVDVRYVRGYDPGVRGYFSDSTTNYLLAGLVLEAVGGVETSQAMRELFLELKLSNTHYLAYGEMEQALLPQMLHGYLPVSHPYAVAFSGHKELTYNKNRELRAYDVTNSYMVNGMANVAVVSNVKDLVSMLQLLLDAKIVTTTYQQMLTSVPVTGVSSTGVDEYCTGFYKSSGKPYGEIIWAAGNSLGYSVFLAYSLNQQKTLCLMTNASRQFFNLYSDGLVADTLQRCFL